MKSLNILLAAALVAGVLTFCVTPMAAQQSTKQEDSTKEKQKKSSEEIEATKVLREIAKVDKSKNYEAMAKLMTETAWDEYCAAKISQAIMMASPEFGNDKDTNTLLKKYKIDSGLAEKIKDLEFASKDEQVALNQKLLEPFKNNKQRSKAIKELERASMSAMTGGQGGDGMMMVIEISPYDGNVESAKTYPNSVTLSVKPNLPPMMGGPGPDGFGPEVGEAFPGGIDELPEGSTLEILPGRPANGLPPGAQIQEFEIGPGGEMPFEGEMAMMGGGIPNAEITFRKVDGKWLVDSTDMRDGGPAHPTIDDPSFDGETISGDSISLKDYRGKLVLLDFWGTWCKGCIEEFPKLKRLKKVLKDRDFEIIGIAQDDQASLERFVKKKPLPWVNVVDDGKICHQFKVSVFPTTLLIDEKGNHVASNLRGKKLVEELAKRLKLSKQETAALAKALKHYVED